MTNTALILVDIQNDYFDGGLKPLPHIAEAAEAAARVLAFARNEGWMVAHIRHVAASDAAPFFRPGTVGSEINEIVAPSGTEPVVQKGRPNSFFGTNLESLLRGGNVDQVVVCGAMSQMCIDATARAAVDLGFKLKVVDDACAAADVKHGEISVDAKHVHAAVMAPLAASYGTILSCNQLIS